MRVTPEGRDVMILELREKGYSLQYIGDVFGLSRERVRQILLTHGVSGRVSRRVVLDIKKDTRKIPNVTK